MMPHAVESLLEVNNVVEEVMLMKQVFLTYDSSVEDLFHCSLSSSESSLLFGQ
ncbi:hypothetical protein DPMN_048080 [Dreissena polymorpha]|uniref:Uncharacterized protein n=1 Tax=Dreissena polymorpha TaxID=45954 RepID=A0A9D4HZS2_DREPO|nr:hypothetical protein DPMN_048080 [Dreissena polymorpha]